jgi:hypothetical protein
MTGALSAVVNIFVNSLTEFLTNNIVFIGSFIALGAAIGFYYAYTRPPTSPQQKVAFFFTRLLSVGCLFKGTNNVFVSFAVIALLVSTLFCDSSSVLMCVSSVNSLSSSVLSSNRKRALLLLCYPSAHHAPPNILPPLAIP